MSSTIVERIEEEHRQEALANLPARESGIAFDEAAALGPIVRVNFAWCPDHGRVTPELLEFPFTITAEALRFVGGLCASRGCEGEVLLYAEACSEPRTQHVVLIEDEHGIRPAIDVKSHGGRWATGVALPKGLR